MDLKGFDVFSIGERVRDNFIAFKIKEHQKIEGFLSIREAIKLYHFASKLPKGSTVIEIGSWKGRSTYCLARGLKEGKVFVIDPFDGSGDEWSESTYIAQKGNTPILDQFISNMQKLNVLKSITTMVGLSSQFLGMFKKIDFLFIDGNHSIEACDFDFINFSQYIPSGGYLALHDFDNSRNYIGPTWVVQNRVLKSKEYKFIGLFDSLWVAQKK